MFENSLMESAGNIKTKKSRTVAVSAVVHVALIIVLVMVPLVFTDQIKGAELTSFLIAPSPPSAPAPARAPTNGRPKPAAAPRVQVDPDAFTAPVVIPMDIAYIVDPAPFGDTGIGVPGGATPGGGTGGPGFMPGPSAVKPPAVGPPPPPPLPPSPPPTPPPDRPRVPIRVFSELQAAKILFQPSPVYPSLARIAHVEGSVVLQATIADDGSVKDLRVVSQTSPLLLTGVIDTVKTWKYKPTLLNNEPVEVLTTITVNFRLGN